MGGFTYEYSGLGRSLVDPSDNTTAPTAAECVRRQSIMDELETDWQAISFDSLTGECQTLYQSAATNRSELQQRTCSGDSQSFNELLQTYAYQLEDLKLESCQADTTDDPTNGGGDTGPSGGGDTGPSAEECQRQQTVISALWDTMKTIVYDDLISNCKTKYSSVAGQIIKLENDGCIAANSFDATVKEIRTEQSFLASAQCQISDDSDGPSSLECERRSKIIYDFQVRLNAISVGSLSDPCVDRYNETEQRIASIQQYECSGTQATFEIEADWISDSLSTLESKGCQSDTFGVSQTECDRRADVIRQYRTRISNIDEAQLTDACQSKLGDTDAALLQLEKRQCSGETSDFQAKEAILADLVYQLEQAGCQKVNTGQIPDAGGESADQVQTAGFDVGTVGILAVGSFAALLLLRNLNK